MASAHWGLWALPVWFLRCPTFRTAHRRDEGASRATTSRPSSIPTLVSLLPASALRLVCAEAVPEPVLVLALVLEELGLCRSWQALLLGFGWWRRSWKHCCLASAGGAGAGPRSPLASVSALVLVLVLVLVVGARAGAGASGGGAGASGGAGGGAWPGASIGAGLELTQQAAPRHR